jgi:hypothetical protein
MPPKLITEYEILKADGSKTTLSIESERLLSDDDMIEIAQPHLGREAVVFLGLWRDGAAQTMVVNPMASEDNVQATAIYRASLRQQSPHRIPGTVLIFKAKKDSP